MTMTQWLQEAYNELLKIGIPSARLDAELILADSLQRDRTYLHAHSDDSLEASVEVAADAQLIRRLGRQPIAYLIGRKEFYCRDFTVSAATLIPRPESEAIIDTLKDLLSTDRSPSSNRPLRLVDVGTGSGCLGITAKLEIPELEVSLLDISQPALEIAHQNAERLKADVTIISSNLLKAYQLKANIIIANLPYVDRTWHCSPETAFEPEIALFADDAGLTLIKQLIDQTPAKLRPSGLLILEADPRQHQAIIDYADKRGLGLVLIQDYCLVLRGRL